MKKITLWYKLIKDNDGVYVCEKDHNHMEDGWVAEEKPRAIKKEYTNQVAWEKSEWRKEFRYITEEYVVVDA